jgi:beta-glucosidase
MIRAVHTFPRGFLWGTATASHQVEGDNRNNDWWAWEQEAGHIAHGHRSAKACDWWGGRWREDLDRSAADAHNAHRFSIEWSRIEPSSAVWDEDALAAYREIAKGALDRGLMPAVTLHHFTNPLWVSEAGGWLNPDVVPLFERYVRKVVTALQDLVGIWVTINEPNLYATLAYAVGAFPPGEKDFRKAVRVARNLTLGHAAAYHAIHQIRPGSLVGLAHHYRAFWPARPGNPLDRWAARTRWSVVNNLIPRALVDGRFRSPIWNERLPQAARTQDYLGFNYYTVERIAFDPRQPGTLFTRGFFPEGSDLSPTGFIANEPEGLWEALTWANASGLPVFVMENGVEDATDRMRPRYLAAHIRQVWRAVNFAWPVRGYFCWTLVDNFEWERGWTQRFGLWELVPETQERRKRPSADFYREICKANALSSDTVAAYAPEAVEWLFPPKGRMRPEVRPG